MRAPNATVLILTPMKTASRYLEGYFKRLETLTYPHNLISLGILEGDSSDDTFSQVAPANDGQPSSALTAPLR